jgi:hypothetical protein
MPREENKNKNYKLTDSTKELQLLRKEDPRLARRQRLTEEQDLMLPSTN